MKLHIVMPVINCVELTKQAIGSIGSSSMVHLIDNASTDETRQWGHHREEHPEGNVRVHYIRNDKRKSVSASWNQGIDFALADPECEYIAILNNDIVLHPKTLNHLMQFIDHTHYLMATGDNIKDRMSIETLLSMELPVAYTDFDCQEINDWRAEGPDFSCFMITRETLRVIGKFDEHFEGAYCEDWDYHIRCNRAWNHIKNHNDFDITPQYVHFKRLTTAPYYHYASQTIARNVTLRHDISTYHGRNQAYYVQKWGAIHDKAMDGEGFVQPFGDATKNWRDW